MCMCQKNTKIRHPSSIFDSEMTNLVANLKISQKCSKKSLKQIFVQKPALQNGNSLIFTFFGFSFFQKNLQFCPLVQKPKIYTGAFLRHINNILALKSCRVWSFECFLGFPEKNREINILVMILRFPYFLEILRFRCIFSKNEWKNDYFTNQLIGTTWHSFWHWNHL